MSLFVPIFFQSFDNVSHKKSTAFFHVPLLLHLVIHLLLFCTNSNVQCSSREQQQQLLSSSRSSNSLHFLHVFPSDLIVDPGTRVSLKCEASGSPPQRLLPQITWTLDGEPIVESDGLGSRVRVGDYVTPVTASVHSFVNISSIRVEDGGVYACTATSSLSNGMSSHPLVHSARVTVRGKAFIKSMRNRTVIAGSTLLLDCPYTGTQIMSPQSTSSSLQHSSQPVFWYKGTAGQMRQLPHNHRQIIHQNGSLLIHKMDRTSDQDVYTCSFHKSVSSLLSSLSSTSWKSYSSAWVRVLVPPLISPFSVPSNVREGMRLTFTCSVLEGDPPFTFAWLKDGSQDLVPDSLDNSSNDHQSSAAVASSRIRISSSNDFSSTLSFTSLSYQDNGNWTCVVRNQANGLSANYTVNMSVKGLSLSLFPSHVRRKERRDLHAIIIQRTVTLFSSLNFFEITNKCTLTDRIHSFTYSHIHSCSQVADLSSQSDGSDSGTGCNNRLSGKWIPIATNLVGTTTVTAYQFTAQQQQPES